MTGLPTGPPLPIDDRWARLESILVKEEDWVDDRVFDFNVINACYFRVEGDQEATIFLDVEAETGHILKFRLALPFENVWINENCPQPEEEEV